MILHRPVYDVCDSIPPRILSYRNNAQTTITEARKILIIPTIVRNNTQIKIKL